MTPQLLTHSRASCFRACPRRHLLRYEYGLRPAIDSFPLRVGSAFARAVEAAANGLDASPAIDAGLEDSYERALVAAMFDGHERRWANDPLEHVAAELPFDLPLLNPATGAPTPIWRMAGKIDRIVRLPDGRLALVEYKTTQRDFAPGKDYWVRLHLDQQLSIYVIAAREMGYDIATVLYDVTRRPGQKVLRATPPEERKYTQKDTKQKDGTVRPAGSLYADQREADESPEEYAARIAQDIATRPDHYFARIEIARLDQDLEDCRWELWGQQKAIRDAQTSGRWYRNPDACFGQTHPCDFLQVCQHRDLDTRTPDGFVRTDVVHPELAGYASAGQAAHAASGQAGEVTE